MVYVYSYNVSCITRVCNGGIVRKKVNVKKDYDWGIGREKMVINHIGDELGKGFEKLGKFDHFDYLGYRNGKQCYVEIKSRRISKDAYEETIVPASKVAKAIELIGMGNKVFFVISFTNGICYLDMSNANFKLGYNARTDRGALELNHYAFIPLEQFKTAEPLNIMD